MTVQTVLRAACAAMLLCGAAGARAEAVRGDINNWQNPSVTVWMATNMAFPGDTNWAVTVACTQTLASAGFKVDQSGDWTNQWGTGSFATNAAVNGTIGQAHINRDGNSPGNLTNSLTSGLKYTFRLQGLAHWYYRPYVIMATTNNPVSVTNVSDTSATAGTNAVTVTAQLSAATSGERVYVRYTTNSFSTWSALATGAISGTTATVMIPGQPSGRTVKYYVLTSTMPTNLIATAYDLCTLRGNVNNGSNYSYLVGTADPVFGNCWHFPTNAEPAGATMRNPTNPAPTLNTYVYVGNYYESGVGGADMTGGWVFYKKSTAGTWSSNSLAWDSTVGFNKYWKGQIPSNAGAAGETLQYYLQVSYTNGGADVTYLGTTNQLGAEKYAQATNAAAHPFAAVSAEIPPVFGNCWHFPTNAEPAGATMRNPTNPAPTLNTFVYVGNYQADADMTGGRVHYKKSTEGAWSTTNLSFDSTAGANNYWKAAIPSNAVTAGETLQYYVEVSYTNGGADTTYLGTTNQTGLVKYAQATNAAAHPFAAVSAERPPDFGNCWHFPTNVEPGTVTMRNPTNPTPLKDTYVYVGNYQPDADLTGGWVFYKKSTAGTWASNNLTYDTTAGNNAYWMAPIPSNAVALGETLQYYVQMDYANGGADTTYLGTTNQLGAEKYAQATNAAAHPFEAVSAADLGNGWHAPANAEPTGAYMRNPRHPYATNTVTIYNGNQFAGSGTIGNQTGGTLYHRLQGTLGWSSAALGFDSEAGNNKYWQAAIPAGTYGKTQTVEYVLAVTYSDRDATYLGTTNQTVSAKYATLSAAQAAPFSFTYGGDPGTEPGFVWHGGNVVRVAGDTVQIWAKIGYEKDGVRWADHAEVRYRITTNGASKRTVQGVARLTPGKRVSAADLTSTNAMGFSHTEPDSSENGNAMWWVATLQDSQLTNLNSLVQYQVAAWKSTTNGGNGVARLAEYQSDGLSGTIFEYRLYSGGAGALTINGQNADYTTTKFFIDEAVSNTVAITVRYAPPAGSTSVEVFSNVGRRDMVTNDWNADGIEDGIQPPDGNLITTNATTAYFTAFPMTWDGTAFTWTTNAGKCGAYRLTARYHAAGQTGTNWTWYSSEGRRDHAIVISPVKVLRQTMYELNTLTVKASNNTEAGRSTFDDLIDPLVSTNVDKMDEFSIEYLNKIQANCLWFQPIHPCGYDRSEDDPATPGTRYNPGSPYATRDYFAVNHFFGRAGTEEEALTEFTNFVAYCDQATNRLGSTNYIGTINVMLDGVFNHTSWDAEFGEMGVELGFCTNKNDKIGWFKPGWYSYWQDYGKPATYYHTAWSNDIATAPDRGDFGKWADVAELYYGKYSCLVRNNPEKNGDYLNEQDVYDFAGMSQDTIDLWKYIGKYTEFWLKKTGHSGTNRPGVRDAHGIAYDDYGIDGLRCDFGQGLPPQLWEYIINRTRTMKWSFMFMAETLDGGVPGYRSNRHFDILNENMVFQFTQGHVSDPASLRSQLESRRTTYNGGAILLNLTGHDEVMPWADPWVTASRYGMVSAVMGVPMMFYGQEQGIGPYQGAVDKYTGFSNFELNFGKWIPHFKKWNQLTVWNDPPNTNWSRYMAQWHGRINWARLNSPALQSPNQYYLNRTGGGDNGKIFAVAKYEQSGAVAAGKDAVLAFALFVNVGDHSGANDTYDLQGCWSQLGLSNSPSVWYNVRNLAASKAENYVWPAPRTGADLYSNGIWVSFDSDGGGREIYDDGAIVQYLKLEEVQPTPLRIAFNPASPIRVPYKELAQFAVIVTDTNGQPVSGVTTNLVTSVPGATFSGGQFSYTVTDTNWVGATNGVQFAASNSTSATSAWMNVVVPLDSNTNGIPDVWERTYFTNYLQTAGGNPDLDPGSNYDEFVANTDPNNPNDFFQLTDIQVIVVPTGRRIVCKTAPDRKYRIEFTDTALNAPLVGWTPFQANGAWTNATAAGSYAFTDDGTANTSGTPLATQRTYRVWAGLP
jgi:hypothetical protein